MPNERLLNVEIQAVSKKTEGDQVGKNGETFHWILYNFTINDPDWKNIWFSYFQTGKKPTPEKGMKIDLLEFEIDDTGQYTNYNVKKLIVPDNKPKPKPKPVPAKNNNSNGKDSPLWFCLSYAKDLQCELLKNRPKDILEATTLDDIVREVVQAGQLMMRLVNKKDKEIPPVIDEDDVPF
jgi:hypothetical protein